VSLGWCGHRRVLIEGSLLLFVRRALSGPLLHAVVLAVCGLIIIVVICDSKVYLAGLSRHYSFVVFVFLLGSFVSVVFIILLWFLDIVYIYWYNIGVLILEYLHLLYLLYLLNKILLNVDYIG
jgi:hypothetical protein